MPGPIRTADEIAALKARARERRAGGEAMQDIAEALGVPASTLYRWAAEGGWRGRDLARERYRAALEDPGPVSSPACGGGGGKAAGGGSVGDTLSSPLAPDRVRGTPPASGGRNNAAHTDEDSPAPPMTPEEARASGEKALRAARALMEAGDLRGADLAMRLSERMLDAAKALAALPKPEGQDKKRGTSGLSLDEARLVIGYRLDRMRAHRLNTEHYPAHPEDMPAPPRPGEIITCEHLGASGLPMTDGGTYPDIPRAALMGPWRPEKGAEGEEE